MKKYEPGGMPPGSFAFPAYELLEDVRKFDWAVAEFGKISDSSGEILANSATAHGE